MLRLPRCCAATARSERETCCGRWQETERGHSLLFVMDLNTLHDVGRSFGTNGDWGDENYTLGAFGELFDASDILAKDSTYYIR